jgi:hypothetical protein
LVIYYKYDRVQAHFSIKLKNLLYKEDTHMSKETESREKFAIDIEPQDFSPIGAFKLTTSSDLGKLANEVFGAAFEDFEGVIFEPGVNGGEPTYSLIFNHGKYGEDAMVGVKSAIQDKGGDSANPLERIRRMDNVYANGAKYLATDDLKDVVESLLVPGLYNNGKPKWNAIVVDYAERSPYNLYSPNTVTQYTKVNGISAKRLASLIFGYEVNGDKFDYEVRVVGPASAQMMSGKATNWVLQISRASLAEVTELYKAYGYNPSASNIIKK